MGRVSYFCNISGAFFFLPFPSLFNFVCLSFWKNKRKTNPKEKPTAVRNQRVVKIRKYMGISPSTTLAWLEAGGGVVPTVAEEK